MDGSGPFVVDGVACPVDTVDIMRNTLGMTQNQTLRTIVKDVTDRLYAAVVLAMFMVIAPQMYWAMEAHGVPAGVWSIVTTAQSVMGGMWVGATSGWL